MNGMNERRSSRRSRGATAASLAIGLILSFAVAPHAAASSYGTLSNFDVVNDTEHECHGFEIEIEDIHTTDVSATFGGTYIRYGRPEVTDTTVDPAHPRVLVRYRHWDGTAWAATSMAPAATSARTARRRHRPLA